MCSNIYQAIDIAHGFYGMLAFTACWVMFESFGYPMCVLAGPVGNSEEFFISLTISAHVIQKSLVDMHKRCCSCFLPFSESVLY